jgi:hypothetical protein
MANPAKDGCYDFYTVLYFRYLSVMLGLHSDEEINFLSTIKLLF